MKVREPGELIQSNRWGMEELEKQKRKMGRTVFDAQYQQQPVPDDGIVIKRNWLRYSEAPPEEFDVKLISWDTASTLSEDADWSVGTVWGLADGEIHLLHIERVRLEVPELRHRIEQMHVSWLADVTLIEDADLGRGIAQDLRRTSRGCKPLLVRARIEKLARMQAKSVMFETGKIFFPREAPWLSTYIDELLGFPNKRHDDQVDSTSQALDWFQHSPVTFYRNARGNVRRATGALKVYPLTRASATGVDEGGERASGTAFNKLLWHGYLPWAFDG